MTRFAPEYVRDVLSENFRDAKDLFLSPLLSIHYAHLAMLAGTGIISRDDAHAIRVALDGIDPDEVRAAPFDGRVEDLFFHVEALIVRGCGPDVAGRLHTARSRNDIDMTMYRMRQRDVLLGLLDATLDLRAALVVLAARHRATLFAAQTHTQPAQPSTMAHYLLAVVEQLERDGVRLRAAFEVTNHSPLGACAITGSGFPIDRALTSEWLGFSGPTGNTYGSIASADHLLEAVAAVSVTMVGLGRFVQDLLLWGMPEFGYLRLPDGFVQGSSIMPQKRNPVALEHARALASRALGEATAVTMTIHNTPFGDVVDTEDDLQPLVASAFHDATRAVRLVAAAMAGADFDVAAMEARAARHGTTLTELADHLVREHRLPFRTAHAIAARLADVVREGRGGPVAAALAKASEELLGSPIRYRDEEIETILGARHFVDVRATLGGPAPAQVDRALRQADERLADDRAAWTAASEALAAAESRLRERCARL